MADNKITIGKGKSAKDATDEIELLKKEELYIPEKETESSEPDSQPESLDDNLWGNDWQINKVIDKDYLAEKRLFVRVRYFQPIECKLGCADVDSEPYKLNRPFRLTMFDLSMGGIGAISDEPIQKNDILVFPIQIDLMMYEVKCQAVYCIPIDNVYRLGFRILTKEKKFIKHLKLFVARLSLMGNKVTFQDIINRYSDEKKY